MESAEIGMAWCPGRVGIGKSPTSMSGDIQRRDTAWDTWMGEYLSL